MKNRILIYIVLLCLISTTLVSQRRGAQRTSSKNVADKSRERNVSISALKLRNVGPAFLSGRIADIAIHPKNNNVWYGDDPKFAHGYGGAIGFIVNTVPSVCSIENCSFAGNEAVTSGGALSIYYPNYEFLTIFNSTFCESTPNHIDGKWIDGGENTFADECPECPDINGDGYVNVVELLSVIDQWGQTDSFADLNFDGIVNVSDLLLIISDWGPCE